jgi:uncharacterized protein YoxC|uniref:Uncharacterized protein n=1 Tax=candidate division WOR-3 bacterium TaxID=2052148 RepID=A0A7V3RH45_UNCW3
MKKLATLMIIAIALAIIGCQPQQQQNVVTREQLDAVKAEISALKSQVANLQTALDSLTANYNAHLDKYHKSMPKPPTGGGTGGGLKPPTQK